jgi:hypothetical protein
MQANENLEFQKQSMKWQNYNLLNVRYSDHMLSIPESVSKNIVEFSKLTPKDRIWIRAYLDLSAEEYWLYKNHLLPEKMWENKISKGIIDNFDEFPMIREGFIHYKNRNSISTDFICEIAKLMEKAR